MISHPEKILFPDDGITKGDLAAYYAWVAPVMLPHISRRPVTMERYHRGIGAPGFFQKDVSKGFPEWLKRVEVPKNEGTVDHPMVTDPRSLLWLANQNSITIHVSPSRAPSFYKPDICVFDLRSVSRSYKETSVGRVVPRSAQPACATTGVGTSKLDQNHRVKGISHSSTVGRQGRFRHGRALRSSRW